MAAKLPISAFIICLNEAGRIASTLDSIRDLVDEIIVVDSGSTDGTQAIVNAYGVTLLQHEWQGYGPQKRFAEEQCRHDWLLNLDADEVLSAPLIEEIRQLFDYGGSVQPPQSTDGYYVNILDCIPGELRPRRFAHTTTAVRLYNKHKGRYADSPVHDRVQFEHANAPLKTLKAPVYHYSVISIEQAIHKLNRYSTMQAQDMQHKQRRPFLLNLRLLSEFPLAFLKSYLLRADILRGRKGFINAMVYAFSRFARVAKVWEEQHRDTSS